MEYELRLPDIGEGVAEGEVVRWLVAAGARVREDDPLVEILTDKAAMEMPSPVSGVVARIVAEAGRTVPVGGVLAVLEVAAQPPGPAREPAPEEAPAANPSAAGPARTPEGSVLATPAVRKLARDLDVDVSSVAGTGPDGRVTENDVRRAAGGRREGGAAPGAGDERIPFRGKRRIAARKMALSKSTVPHALLVDEAEATALVAAREVQREVGLKEGVRITILPFVLRVVVAALRAHPAMNASLDEERGEIVRKKRYDIGMAVDAEDGLVVPVVRDAGDRTIVELAREIERLADGARAGTLSRTELSGSTFTVTSIGSIGGLFSYPVINVPEAAILGVHRIVRRPVVRDGEIVARDMIYLSLSFDHRLIDGGTATRFLNDLIAGIESISTG